MAVLACMAAVAAFYQLPAQALPAIYRVEGGRPGYVQRNRNGTDDLGSMQINSTWLPVLVRSTGLPRTQLRSALIHQDCFNVAVAGAILRVYLNEAGGNLVRAVGYYHSHTPGLRVAYQMRVMRVMME